MAKQPPIQPVQNKTLAAQNPPLAAAPMQSDAPLVSDFSDDPNYSGDVFVVNFPAMQGDVLESIAALRSLRRTLILQGPKPNYSVHGERWEWADLLRWINTAIMELTKEAIALQPRDLSVGIVR